jgi:hypothetical protein
MKVILCCLIILAFANVCLPKAWRGIEPLKSTRADVERLLGAPKQKTTSCYYYRFRDELAAIWFQDQPCDRCGLGWNVSPGTVTGIGVIPLSLRVVKTEDFAGFQSEDTNAGVVYYSNYDDGLVVESLKGQVTLFSYLPEKKLANLECPSAKNCIFDFFPKFDEYRLLPWADEKARLDNFTIHLQQTIDRGAIVVLGSSELQRRKLIQRAVRARAYMARLGLETQRILIVDGGYSEESLFELHDYSIGGFMHRIYLWPRKDPQKLPAETRQKRTSGEDDR